MSCLRCYFVKENSYIILGRIVIFLRNANIIMISNLLVVKTFKNKPTPINYRSLSRGCDKLSIKFVIVPPGFNFNSICFFAHLLPGMKMFSTRRPSSMALLVTPRHTLADLTLATGLLQRLTS